MHYMDKSLIHLNVFGGTIYMVIAFYFKMRMQKLTNISLINNGDIL